MLASAGKTRISRPTMKMETFWSQLEIFGSPYHHRYLKWEQPTFLSFPFLVATIVDSIPIVVNTQQFIFEVEHLSMSRFLEERNSSFKRCPFSDSPMSRRLLTSDLEPWNAI